jgi:hypothetical protein
MLPIGIVAMIMVMFWCGAAMALNPNDCPDWFGPQWQCNGRVELSDMGEFNGDQFVWNGLLADAIQAWDSNVITNSSPYREFQGNKGWLQIRNYATPDPAKVQTRVTATAGTKTFSPVLWSVTCIFDGQQGVGDPNECPPGQEAFFMDATPPAGCDTQNNPYASDYNLCIEDYPQYATINCAGPNFCGYDMSTWNDPTPDSSTPICATIDQSTGFAACGFELNRYACQDGIPELGVLPTMCTTDWPVGNSDMNADPNVDICCKQWTARMEQIDFAPVDPTGVTVRWVEKNLTAQQYAMPYTGKFPKYKLYPINFWDWPAVGEGWVSDTDYLADFFVLPDSTGLQHFEFMINGVVQATYAYVVTSLDPMPTVTATREVDGETKLTMHAKQIKGGLKITWDDPPFKDIQKPGIQLRVYVGAQTSNGGYERYYWIDCPAQIHKMLVPMDQWQELKDTLIADGFTEATISIVYRTMTDDFMNRGHSDPIIVPIQ